MSEIKFTEEEIDSHIKACKDLCPTVQGLRTEHIISQLRAERNKAREVATYRRDGYMRDRYGHTNAENESELYDWESE